MSKTIALFGASGQTGQQFLDLALANGYKVKTLVRTPSKIGQKSKNLTIIEGDVLNSEQVFLTMPNPPFTFIPKQYVILKFLKRLAKCNKKYE